MMQDMLDWYGEAADAMYDMVDSPMACMLGNGSCDGVLRVFGKRYGSEWVHDHVTVDEIACYLSQLYLGWDRTDDMVRLGEVVMALYDSDCWTVSWKDAYGDKYSMRTIADMLTGDLEQATAF